MKTTTIGDLITNLVEELERRYDDHELATVKAALVVDELLRRRRHGAARSVRAGHLGAAARRRGAARKAA